MTSTRPYRTARSPEEALAELEQGAGTQFDPTVVRVLSSLVRDRLETERAA
jgi:HD-GYP domain-containing protein (c-di-GMP phosphodiesterase class II)